jgi:hypothetical protein
MQKRLRNIAIATTPFACAMLLSFGWSEQRGISLSVEGAQARVGRPLTPVSVAGVARRNNRRATYGYGAAAVGAGMAAGAIGTAAVAAAAPGGYYSSGYYPSGYYRSGAYAPAAYYGQPSAYADSYAYAGTGSGWTGYASSPWGSYHCQLPHAYDCRSYDENWHW